MWVYLLHFFIFSIENELFKQKRERGLQKLVQFLQFLNYRANIGIKRGKIQFPK